ncbi:MAG: hypothetical protein HZB56_15070 [Deltaproteobacteria bacterium]|nr:hypothetical protein [Deltaproteobacteria bacterium]
MLAVDRAALQPLDATSDAAWRRTVARPADLSHAERVTLGEARADADRPSARATADVRWYRAAQARHAGSAAVATARAAPQASPVHTAVQAYRRTMAMEKE